MAPRAHELALALVTDPAPLVGGAGEDAGDAGPRRLEGRQPGLARDGRTILLDWGWPAVAGPLVDIGWYLGVNCDRLPESKEDTIDAYRGGAGAARDRHRDWWDRQLELALLGAFLQLGWSKSGAELGWWLPRIVPVAESLLDQ